MRASKHASRSASAKVEPRRKAAEDADIDYTDTPDRGDDDAFWASTVMVWPQGRPPAKRPIAIRLDPDVLAFFQEEGRGYQTRINHVLRAYVQHRQRSGAGPATRVLVKRAEVGARKPVTEAGRRSSKKR